MRKIILLICCSSLLGCISIPKETVTLSETLGKDIVELQRSHLQLVTIHFTDLKTKVNTFVDQVYAPFVINYVLKDELQLYQSGETSLYTTLMNAAESTDQVVTSQALEEMSDFLEAAREQIETKRSELLDPIEAQELEVITTINTSYSNALYANATLTAHLRSIRKVKDAQAEALELVGLEGLDDTLTENLIKASGELSKLLEKAQDIDSKSDDAYGKLEEITDKIKEITNKKE